MPIHNEHRPKPLYLRAACNWLLSKARPERESDKFVHRPRAKPGLALKVWGWFSQWSSSARLPLFLADDELVDELQVGQALGAQDGQELAAYLRRAYTKPHVQAVQGERRVTLPTCVINPRPRAA